ncbi:MAG: hypothetical protein R3200_10655 [Xanthomonadales bacterium]|nr:hypothetical protein [Xanthomonadales bacterium]
MKKLALAAALAGALAGLGSAQASSRFDPHSMVGPSFGAPTQIPGRMLAMTAGGMNLGVWHNYTRQALLPDFSSQLGYSVQIDLGLLANHEYLLVPGFAQVWEAPTTATRLTLDLVQGRVSDSPLETSLANDWFEVDRNGVAIDRVLFAPGFSQRFGDGGKVDVAAVFANQRYGSWGLGMRDLDAYRYPTFEEQSAGAGVRLGISSELSPGIEMGVAYQSRIDMDEFQTYRGVYSEPGDFDIPASANLGIVVQAGQKSSLSVDIQRVLYSEVNTFTSTALPDRFLSLLGDAGSPEFAWEDLTIYRVGWNWKAGKDWDWRVQYSTSQQPMPTSQALNQALASEIADSNVSVGFSKKTWDNARVDFAATYASEYFLGPINLGRTPDIGDDQIEFEVRLVWDF